MELVNSVYKTRLANTSLNLQKLSTLIPNSDLHVGRPTQLKVVCPHNANVVCLIFGRGAIRIMGKGIIDICDAYMILFDILPYFTTETPTLEVQTMTFTATVSAPINLIKFAETWKTELNTHASFELFSALQINKFRPIAVNLFSTGKLVICGAKCEQQASVIHATILMYVNKMSVS